jgi:hypothetical protein
MPNPKQPYKGSAAEYEAETERRRALLDKMAPPPPPPPKPKKKRPYEYIMDILKTGKL